MKQILIVQGGGSDRICVAAVFLDHFFQAEGFYRALLLHRRGGPGPAPGPL